MKRFQRVNAFILALSLFMSMIPAGVLDLKAVAVEPTPGVGDNFLHAAYAAEEITVDGKPDAGYRFDVPVGALRLAAAWDLSNLYLAIESDDVSSVSKLQVNGVNVTGGVKDDSADTACTEYQISLADAKITNLTGTNTLTIKVGDAAPVTLYLVLGVNQYAQTVYMEAVNGATRGGTLYASSSGTVMTLKGTKDDGTATYQGGVSKNQEGAVASTATTTVFEFDVSDLTLPDTSTLGAITNVRRNFCTGGLAVTLRDDLDTTGTAAFVLSLSKNNGNVVLNYFDNNNSGTAGWVEVPVAAAEKYHIRVEYSYTDNVAPIGTLDANDTVSAKYFVNGKCVAEGNDVRQVGGNKGTTGTKLAQFYVNGTKNTNLQVTVSDVSVTKHDPSAYNDLVKVKAVMDLIDAIGEPVTLDSKAAVKTAREQYNLLSDGAKAMVANLSKLENAEAQLNTLEKSTPYAMFVTTQMTLDGKVSEAIYTRAVWLNETLKLSLAWDPEYLYLALTDSQTPVVSSLVINDKTVTLNSNYTVATTGVREIRIPLNELGIVDLTKTYSLSLQVGSLTWGGQLIFDTTVFETMKLAKEATFVAYKDLTARSTTYVTLDEGFTASTTETTVVEFDLDINSLPEDTTAYESSSPYVGKGLNFQFADNLAGARDDGYINQAFKFGFFLRDGVIKLGHAANGTNEFVAIDDDGSGQFHVRVEYSYSNNAAKTVSARYYINDALVATGENVRVNITSLGTKGNNRFFLKADAGVKDAVWSNLSISKTNPGLQSAFVTVGDVINVINSIGTVTLDKELAIVSARAAYDALDDQVKYLVTNLSVLENAERELSVLKNSYLHAVFATSVVVDGNLNEAGYRRVLPLSESLFVSAAWDTTNLYLAFAGSAPNVTQLKVNGHTVTVPAGSREIAVNLVSVGIGNYADAYNLSLEINGVIWSGKLVMDTADYEALSYYTLYAGATGSEDKMTVVLDSRNKSKESDPAYTTYVSYKAPKLESVTGDTTVLEFAFDPTYLPNEYTASGLGRYFMNGGLGVLVRDQQDTGKTEGFMFGFGKKNGEVRLFYYSVDDKGAAQANEVSLNQSSQYYVRVEFTYGEDKTVSAKYYINGVMVDEAENVRVLNGNFGTTSTNYIQFYAGVANGKESATNYVNVQLQNVAVSHLSPALAEELQVTVKDVENMIANIGTVTMDRAPYIEATQAKFESLSALAQQQVKNADVLRDAVSALNKLENSHLHAVFAPTSVVLDGKADEAVYGRYLRLGTTKFGAAWDAKNLYLYFADTATPQIAELKINGKTVTFTSANSKTTTGVREIRLALKDLGITGYADTYPVSIKIGNQEWFGKLILDNVDFGTVPHGNLYGGAVSLNDKLGFKMDTWAVEKEGDSNYMSFGQVVTDKFAAVTGAATVVEFALDIENMPNGYTANSAPSRAFLNNGITVSIRDDQDTTGKNGFVFGLGKKDGQLYLIGWYTDAANKAKKVEIPVGKENNCYVRVEYAYKTATNVTAKYYINGVLIHEQENSYLTGASFGTSTANLMQIFAIVPAASTSAAHKVVATVNNISVGHTQPTLANDLTTEVPKVEALIKAIGLPITLNSKDKVNAALEAYNKLSDLAKTQVSNKKDLETAQARLKMLENSYVHAAFSSEELVRDGKIFEDAYHMNVKLTDTLTFGAAWTKNYLYLAFVDEKSPAVEELVINGVNLGKATRYSAKGSVGREIRIPLSELGIVGYDKTYQMSFRIGDIYWSGTLVQDSIDYETLAHGNTYYGAAGSNDKKTIFLNTLTPDANGGNKNRSLIMVANQNLASWTGKNTILNMDVVINNMPDNCTVNAVPSRNFIKDGVTFAFNDDLSAVSSGTINEAFVFGLGKQNGQLKLFYWYNDANGEAKLGVEDIPEAASYHLRVEYGNGNGKVTSAKYFVNGLFLAETVSSRVNASTGTGSVNVLQMFAQATLENEAGRVDLTISQVSVGHPQRLIIDDKSAAAYMDDLIVSIGTVTLETAAKINEARAYYDSLTAAQKKLVTKLSVLQAAEAKLRTLKAQYNAQFTNYAFAEYTTEEMVIDGKHQEKIWRAKQTINGDGMLGMAWDFNYLYLTFTGSKINTLSNLKINGVSVSNLGVTNGNIREMKVLLSSIGIPAIDFNATYDLSFTLNGKTFSAELVFDTGKYAVIKPTSTFWGGSKDLNDAILISTDSTRDGKRVGIIYDSTKLESTNGMTTIMEFDVKVNAMPNNGEAVGNSRNFVKGGLSFCIRDEDVTVGDNNIGMEAFMVGLVKQQGNMYLVYWEASTEEYIYVLVDDFGTSNYHLRIEYDYQTNDDVYARYYVNGLMVAESYDAKQIIKEGDGPYGTSGTCRMQVMAYATADGAIDAVVSDLSISKNRYMENPDPRDEITKDAIFGTQDLNHVQKDLNLPKEFVTINGERFQLTWKTSNASAVTKEGKVTRSLEDTTSAKLTVVVDGDELWSVTVKVDPMNKEEAESPENVDAAFSKAPIVIDGILDDEGWRMSGRALDRNKQVYAEYGFQWTQSYLYVAVEYLNGLDTLSLKLNNRYFTLKDGKLYRGGEDVGGSGALVVTNGDVVEMRIPLSVLGLPSKIDSYGYSIPVSVKAGPYVGNSKNLRLSNIDWVITVNRNQETLGETMKSTDAYHGTQRLDNGYRMFDLYGGTNKAKVRSYVYLYRTDEYYENFSDRTYATYFECDFYAEALPILPTDGSAFRPTGGIYSVSGPTITLSDAAEPNNYSKCCSFGIINTIHGLMFVLNVGGAVQTVLMHKEVGEKFSLGVEWASDDSLKVFVDGELLTTFYGATSYKSGSGDASLGINLYPFFEPQSQADNYDVYFTNIGFGKVHYEENLLNQLTFEDIRGKNRLESKITSDLVLPQSITNGQLDKAYKITWTSNNPAINAATGKVTRPETGAAVVTLTATLANGESKSFTVIVYGSKAQNAGVMHVVEDLNPATGVGATGKDFVFTLDTTNNSIIKVLDGKSTINYVVLKDGDDRSRLVPENLTLWISDDNQTYTRIKNFKLLQVGDKWYLYDFEADGKYVKVHYTQPDAEECSFIGTYGEMIDAGYQNIFGAADNATFTQTQYVLTNNTGKDRQDYAWTISKKALGITGNDAAIRIYANGSLLYHYVSGTNVVVRINDLAAGESVTLKVLSSNSKDVMDISNKEGVHEVIYGVRETTLSTSKYYYMTLPAGTTFPDGSKLEKETLFSLNGGGCRLSTDGGLTWDVTYDVKNNAPAGKEPVTKMSQGGWIFDSVTGRIMFECYYSQDKVVDEGHLHTSIIASDDGGKTWYLQFTMPCRLCMDEYFGDNNIPRYTLSYSDGIQLSTYDGKGPNVDFVFPAGYSYDNDGNFGCYICYSTDAGDTWKFSKNPVTYPSTYIGSEGGCSEGWIYERSDGVLVLQVRCQDSACIHFKVSYSFDHGISWTNENIYTDFYAVNGQAVAKYMEVNGETTLISAWAGNSSLGGDTYHRNPFVFGSSANEGETFRNIQNITFRSFEERYEDIYTPNTTNIYMAKAGNNLIFNYTRNRKSDKANTVIEDFDDWFTRTKGGYDNFEHGTVRYEGWQKVYGIVDLATDIAQGNYSMKIGYEAKAVRSVPYLQDGKVSVDIYVPAGGGFTFELQSGHTRYYNSKSVPIAIRSEGGKIYFGDSTTPAAEGIKEGWNTLVFDLNLTKDKATLSINGGAAINVPLKMDFDDYVNFITIGTNNSTQIYVDEVLVISELEPDVATDEADKQAAAEVVELIKAIKNSGNREAAIKKAREAFDKLTQAQQDLVDMRVLANNGKSGLDGMINYYEELRLYEDGELVVEQMIDEIGEVTFVSGEAIKFAENAYKKLTSAQKSKVSNYGTLRVARLKYNRIISHKTHSDQEAVETVQEMIDSLVLTNPLRYEDKIKAARKAFSALSPDQFYMVDTRHLYQVELKLVEAREVETARKLASMQQLINSLDGITLQHAALIEGLRTAFSKLTAEEKAVINDYKLVQAEKLYRSLKLSVDKKTLDDIRIAGIISLIDSIGEATMEKKALIDAIRASYDKLSEKQQEKVENYDTLVIAEAAVLVQIQMTDMIPQTGDMAPGGITEKNLTFVMPALLVSAMAMTALVIVPKKRKRR